MLYNCNNKCLQLHSSCQMAKHAKIKPSLNQLSKEGALGQNALANLCTGLLRGLTFGWFFPHPMCLCAELYCSLGKAELVSSACPSEGAAPPLDCHPRPTFSFQPAESHSLGEGRWNGVTPWLSFWEPAAELGWLYGTIWNPGSCLPFPHKCFKLQGVSGTLMTHCSILHQF